MLERPNFQSKSYPPPILNEYVTKMYRRFGRIRQYSTESRERLQSSTAFYSCKVNAMVKNYIEQNILSNFVRFGDLGFASFKDFEQKFKFLILVILNLNLKSLKFNIWVACLLCLVYLLSPQNKKVPLIAKTNPL